MSPIRPAPSLQSISSSRSTQKPTSNERQHGFSKSKDGYTKSQEVIEIDTSFFKKKKEKKKLISLNRQRRIDFR
jgi:hypothetical protein